MRTIDLGDAHLHEIEPHEFSLVRQICEEALNSTFLSSTGQTEILDEEGDGGPLVSEEAFRNGEGIVYKLVLGAEIIGGVFLRFLPRQGRGAVTLLGIREDHHGRGLGRRILRGLEKAYPEITVWQLESPVFALRNVAFYVNTCGFRIVEITKDEQSGDWDMFRFEKSRDCIS